MFYAECIDIPGVHIFSKKIAWFETFFLYFDRFTEKGERGSCMKEELN